ncbi:GntR family transcriptional regulator [Microbacterium sp. No. 7]|uniref:GntR family transcriptional regulator n=1 Tax=Microbacterium sp. No. 7 TaxID=1714373 RepID=UPI0006D0A93D|nr:GntR family transcriptional regulator [Microbacterium sp. No. 7]ALJ19256.1 GntR family transcriptional regulator [Microbacterium sp. No. 7]
MTISNSSTATRADSGRKQLPDEVAGHVREQILSGVLKPGEFLRMEPIAETLGVSITPVREGLVKLAGEGFVTSLPRRGFVVTEITRDDVRDIFWAQGQIAGELAARAAVRITDEEIAELEQLYADGVAAIERGDVAEAGRLRQQFLRFINITARAGRLQKLLLTAVRQLPTPYYISLEAHADETAPVYVDLLEAMRAHDGRRARSITEKHRQKAATRVIKLLEARGFWSTADE